MHCKIYSAARLGPRAAPTALRSSSNSCERFEFKNARYGLNLRIPDRVAIVGQWHAAKVGSHAASTPAGAQHACREDKCSGNRRRSRQYLTFLLLRLHHRRCPSVSCPSPPLRCSLLLPAAVPARCCFTLASLCARQSRPAQHFASSTACSMLSTSPADPRTGREIAHNRP